MRIPRLYLNSNLSPGRTFCIEGDSAHYLGRVLRLAEGASVLLFNGDGHEYSARLGALQRGQAELEVLSISEVEPEPALKIHLGVGVSKGERMDWMLQKSVELGVSAITPLMLERTVVRLDSNRLSKRMNHWRGVVTAACEQSGRCRVPDLGQAVPLQEWLTAAGPGALWMLDHRSSLGLVQAGPPREDRVTLLTGPEGGISEAERKSAREAGFVGVRLGPRVLRTETAPLAALAAIQALWGDLG